MKCVVNWIPLRIRVRSKNTQPHLNRLTYHRSSFPRRWDSKCSSKCKSKSSIVKVQDSFQMSHLKDFVLNYDDHFESHLLFWFLVWYAATRLATQLQQRCTQEVCDNKEARKRLTESNGTPAMDLRHMNVGWMLFEVNIRICRYTHQQEIAKINIHSSRLMLGLDILLSMLSMWIVIIIYFDFSHVSIQFPCIRICISLSSWFVLNARYMIKTIYTWKDIVTWAHVQNGNDFNEYYLAHHAK